MKNNPVFDSQTHMFTSFPESHQDDEHVRQNFLNQKFERLKFFLKSYSVIRTGRMKSRLNKSTSSLLTRGIHFGKSNTSSVTSTSTQAMFCSASLAR